MKKIIFVGNTSWSMYNFRFGLMNYFKHLGFEVIVISPEDSYSSKIVDAGLKYYKININNKGTNPFNDLQTFYELHRLYKFIKPSIIFHYTVKPNIYGTLAAKINKIPSIAIITGLGYAFIADNIISIIVKILYKISLKHANCVWFLNKDDRDLFIQKNLVELKKTFVLKSEGININKFKPMKLPKEDIKFSFLLIARMLWDKGVGEFIEAAKIIKNKNNNVEFQLLGFLGVENPSAISKEQIEIWVHEGIVNYLGSTDDVREYIAKVDCVVLPSYREGTGRTLVEACSMEIPVIATDTIGCKEVVDDGLNGYLCKIMDFYDLATKMEKIMNLSQDERAEMGRKGRIKMLNEFDENVVFHTYLEAVDKFSK